MENETIVFKISDNGSGMEEDFIKKLTEGVIEPKGSGIGIKNINERLQIIYGDKYSLKIDSEIMKGTTVTIKIPAWKLEDFSDSLNIEDNYV